METINCIHQNFENIFDSLPGTWGGKDKHCRYIYLNDEFKTLLGLEPQTDILGRTDYEMPCETSRCRKIVSGTRPLCDEHFTISPNIDVHPF